MTDKTISIIKNCKKLVNVLEYDEVVENCFLCSSKKKISHRTIDDDFLSIFDDLPKKCKFCLISLSKRKICYELLMDYIVTYNIRDFYVRNFRKYVEEVYQDPDLVFYSIRVVLKDLVNNNIIRGEKRSGGIRYYIEDEDILSVKKDVLTKAFGFIHGIKDEKYHMI